MRPPANARRDAFLDTMNATMPWAQLCCDDRATLSAAIGACQLVWSAQSDRLRTCVATPDAMTPLTFRRRPETHKLGEQLFAEVGRVLQASGVKLMSGTIVGATIGGAPSGTKNEQNARDPEMYQPRKGKQWSCEQRCISVWTVGSLWRIARYSRQLTCMTGTRCRNCCTAKNGDSTARALCEPECAQRHAPCGWRHRRGSTRQEQQQVEYPGPGRGCLRARKRTVRICQGALSQSGKQCRQAVRRARTSECQPIA